MDCHNYWLEDMPDWLMPPACPMLEPLPGCIPWGAVFVVLLVCPMALLPMVLLPMVLLPMLLVAGAMLLLPILLLPILLCASAALAVARVKAQARIK